MGFRKQDEDDANAEDNKLKGFDPQNPFKMGDRECSDVFCCLIYVLTVIACIGITGYAYAIGNPQNMLQSYDNNGRRCGASGVLIPPESSWANFPVKVFVNLKASKIVAGAKDGSWAIGVCAKKCPKKGDKIVGGTDINADYITLTNSSTTKPQLKVSGTLTAEFDTQQIGGYCLPAWSAFKQYGEQLYSILNKKTGGSMTRYMVDLYESWQVLAGMAFGSFAITLIYVALLRCCVRPLLYTSLVGLLLFGGAFAGWNIYKYTEAVPGSQDASTALWIGIITGVVTLIYLICLCCMWHAISLGASVIEACSDFLTSNMRIAIVPIVTFFLYIPIFCWWLIGSVYLYGTGKFSYVPGDAFPTSTLPVAETAMFWVLLVGMLWIIIWLSAFGNFIIASAACQWYFFGQGSDIDRTKNDVKLCLGVGHAFKYHMGTLAVGSFLVTLCTIIKFIFEYFAAQAEGLAGDNCCVNVLIQMARCCIWCVDCCIRFISDNAYIQTAMKGSNFCESAQASFYMMIRNPAAWSALSYISWIMFFLGKGLIVTASSWLTYILTQYALGSKIQQPLVPAIANGLWAFLISSLFLGIFDFSGMAILQCFCVNYELGGTYYTPDSLVSFIEDLEEDHAKGEGSTYEKKYNARQKQEAARSGAKGPSDKPNTTEDANANGMS